MTEIGDLSRNSAVVHFAADWETLIVTGPERLTWLDGLVTCEVKALTPGQGTWGLVLNRQGKIQTPLWMVADSDRLWLAVAPGTRQTVRAELDHMLIMEDAELDLPETDLFLQCKPLKK
jgi:folate-binding Fe-S cluster repair protein YgfZ